MAKYTADDYSDAELLALCKQAIADVLVGKLVTFRGKTVSRENLSELRELRKELESNLGIRGGLIVVNTNHARSNQRTCE
jgi:hypothetical protein